MKQYVSFCRNINRALTLVGVLILAFSIILTFVQVILRNFVGFSFKWAEETTRYLVIYAVYLVTGRLLIEGRNSVVDLFYNIFPKGIRKVLDTLFYLLIAVFLLVMMYYVYTLVSRNVKIWCASIHIPWAVPFAALIVGSLNMLIQIPAKLYLVWTDGTVRENDGTAAEGGKQ